VEAGRAATNHATQQSPLTQKLRQNTNKLQLGGMNNQLHAVMTIFAQQSNISSSNFERKYGAFPPLVTRLATVIVMWFCLETFVASAGP